MDRLLILAIALAGCRGADDAFFVHRDGADLPVWLQGDPGADTIVVMQHGSGATGYVYDWMPAFDGLEARGAVVYWDQRGAGQSQGQAQAEQLTLDESVQDLALVLDVVRERYAPEQLVLMGHSLGGGLSQAFLRDPDRAAGIHAYVDVSGARSVSEAYTVVRGHLLDRAEAWGDETMAAFYEARSEFPCEPPDRFTHSDYVDRALLELGFDQAASTAEMSAFLRGRGLSQTLFGPFDVFAYGQNTARFITTFDLDSASMSQADVSTIAVPTLLLAGRFDYAVPVEVSQATYEAFAEDDPTSTLVVLEGSAHFPMWDEPEAFSAAVLSFLDELPSE